MRRERTTTTNHRNRRMITGMLHPLDHIFVVIIVVLWPLVIDFARFPFLKARVEAGVPGARTRMYAEGIITQWVLTALALFIWLYTQRPAADLGFALVGGWRFWVGVGAVVTLLFMLLVERRKVARDPSRLEDAFAKNPASVLLPSNSTELFYFHILSVTAGFCEEVLFRGFLIWYLSQTFGIVLSVVLSSVLFGFAHLYQGRKGMLQTSIVGLVLATAYTVTGMLWVPMLLHTLVDMNSGLLGYEMHQSRWGVGPPPEEPEEGDTENE